MSLLMVQSKVKPEAVAELDAAAERVFRALEQAQPAGVRYASCKLSDGVTYVALLALEEGAGNPLLELPEFLDFQDKLKGWVAEQPVPVQMGVLGSYKLF